LVIETHIFHGYWDYFDLDKFHHLHKKIYETKNFIVEIVEFWTLIIFNKKTLKYKTEYLKFMVRFEGKKIFKISNSLKIIFNDYKIGFQLIGTHDSLFMKYDQKYTKAIDYSKFPEKDYCDEFRNRHTNPNYNKDYLDNHKIYCINKSRNKKN
jgi:hypothetical protein